jgi:hypothetical protein
LKTVTYRSAAQSAAITIASVCASLVNRQFQFPGVEEQLVIEAIRRSSNKLKDSSYDDLADHIGSMDERALIGFGSNVKGIYHELLFVHAENADDDDISAEVFGKTNHPGADVRLIKDGEVIDEIQLKATDQSSLVERHLDRYPDIPILATSEAAAKVDDVETSGFSNKELDRQVDETLLKLEENDAVNHAEDVAVVSGLLSAATQAKKVLKGERSVERASEQSLQDMGVAVTSTFLVDLMFGS